MWSFEAKVEFHLLFKMDRWQFEEQTHKKLLLDSLRVCCQKYWPRRVNDSHFYCELSPSGRVKHAASQSWEQGMILLSKVKSLHRR